MRFVLPWRSRAATYLLLPGVLLAGLYSLAGGNPSYTQGYWVGAVSSATEYMAFSCGLGALAAAVDASRARRSRVMRRAPARAVLKIAAIDLWPTVVMAVTIQSAGLLLNGATSWGSPGRFPWEVLGAWAAMILFHIVMGYLFGLAMPLAAAAPLALLASYSWLGFPWAVSYVPFRYLSGLVISGCCAVYSELDSQAVIAVSVFSLAGAGGGALLIGLAGTSIRRRLSRILASIAAVAAGGVAGLSIATGLGSTPTPPRPAADLNCQTTEAAEICFYPEQLWASAVDPVAVVDGALTNIRDAGIDIPERVSGSLADLQDGETLMMLYRRDFTHDDVVHSTTSWFGYYESALMCTRDSADPTVPLRISQVVSTVMYFYATGGARDPFISDPRIYEEAREAISWPEDERSEWLLDARHALRSCDPLPALPSDLT